MRLSRPEVTLHYTLSIIGGSEGAVDTEAVLRECRDRGVSSQADRKRAVGVRESSGGSIDPIPCEPRILALGRGVRDVAAELGIRVFDAYGAARGRRSGYRGNPAQRCTPADGEWEGPAERRRPKYRKRGDSPGGGWTARTMVYNDRRVREALAIAVDWNAIVATVMSGAGDTRRHVRRQPIDARV